MPELPEVETVVRTLRPVLEGKTIERLELLHPRVWRDSDPVRLKAAAQNAQILSIRRRGKYILWELKDRPTLVVHLRMSGQLILANQLIESPHLRACFHMTDDPLVHFLDARTFGTIFLIDGTEPAGFRSLGIEPLSEDFTPRALMDILRDRKTPIKAFLLMQDRIAGIGNIYASEALWRAKIHPETPAARIRGKRAVALHRALVEVLSSAVDQLGTTLSDFRRPDGEPGGYGNQLDVYGREGEPCPRCGRPLTRIVQHGRSTFFCSRCQLPPRRG